MSVEDTPDGRGTDDTGDAGSGDDAGDTATPGPETDTPGERRDIEVLAARLERVTAENERLRREYARARQRESRRAAGAMALLGLLALAGVALLDRHGDVLLALGGTGLFAAALTYYLSPTRIVPASVGERVHDAHAATAAALVDELGLGETRVYVPAPAATDPVRLFVPQHADYRLPESLDRLLVVTDDAAGRGLAAPPTGAGLYTEFEATVSGDPASEPTALAEQLAETAVEGFELAAAVRVDPDLAADRLVVAVSDPLFGTLDEIDHPLVSLFGCGLAIALDEPVTVTVADDGETPTRVVYEW